jgi:hypothetical protein
MTSPFAIFELGGLLVFQIIGDTTLSGSNNAYERKLTNYWVIFVLRIDVKIQHYPIQVQLMISTRSIQLCNYEYKSIGSRFGLGFSKCLIHI